MKFNYSKLLGKIKECGLTQAEVAKAIGINKATLNAKLNGRYCFTTSEILAVSSILNIPKNEISNYFFAQ